MKIRKAIATIACACLAIVALAACTTEKTISVNGHEYKTVTKNGIKYEYIDDILQSIDGVPIKGEETVEPVTVEEVTTAEEITTVDETTTEDKTTPAETTLPEETKGGTSAEPEQTTAETPAETEPETEKNVTTSLSEDPFSWQIAIDGTVLELPFAYSEAEAIGYKFSHEDYAEKDLPAMTTTSGGSLVKYEDSKDQLVISIYNDSNNLIRYKDAKIDIFTVYYRDGGVDNVVFPGGITRGSTIDEVRAVFGDIVPSLDKDYGYSRSLKYDKPDPDASYSNLGWIQFDFNSEGILTTVTVKPKLYSLF